MTISIKRSMRWYLIPMVWAISGMANVTAQPAGFEAPMYTPYAREFLSLVVFENAISSTVDGLEVIPEGVKLELAFREVLQEKEYYHLIAPGDWWKLHSIPSPNDAQFILRDMADLGELCERYLNRVSTIVEATCEYDALRRQSESTITDLYRDL